MAIEILDEHEQGERVRSWLRQNGGAIIGGVALGLGGIFGWQWWQGNQLETRITAATQYAALEEAVERQDRDTLEAIAATLAEDHPGSPYASMAALQLAEQQFLAGAADDAAKTLESARSTTTSTAMRGLLGLRLARLRIAQGDHQAALELLSGPEIEGYAGMAAELRGDAQRGLGRKDEAVAAYQEALGLLDSSSQNRSLVEMKLAELGGETPEA